MYHITHNWGGGTQKYVDDLVSLFPEVKHTVLNQQPLSINSEGLKCVHIHSTMVGNQIRWDVLRLAEFFKEKNIPMYLSIHDYQWLYPENPNPSTEYFESTKPNPENVKNFMRLVRFMDKVFVHTKHVYERYRQFTNEDFTCLLGYPCDIPVRYENRRFPAVNDVINVVNLGGSSQHKGFDLFLDASRKFTEYKGYKIMYHVYGWCPVRPESQNLVYRGEYDDKNIINILEKNDTHIVTALSLAEETYSYTLSKLINTGLPIVYTNRGSFVERLFSKNEPRFFSIEVNIETSLTNAIEYLLQKGEENYKVMSTDVQKSQNYFDYLP